MIRISMIAIIAIIFCDYSHANPSNITINDVKDMSFKECLDINYSKLGLYEGHYSDLNDRSYLLKWYAIDNDSLKKSKDLKMFIKKESGDFYLAKPPLKETKDVNVVFSLCMNFYKSKKLSDYIAKNIFD
ncbi:hypothetical protein QF91_003388 [Salmonella enterica subsp. salamae]|nr:hypothetical protein [Salmonella enterica subsp. salamae]EHM1751350.1 hypothetical protein [Salmonella enterica subsp. salamae serovar 40:c:e,n,x,z15]EIU8982603.1 hypothetical protein [Salmonella enterica]HCM2000796.1 hypothetical protein [Salmonella enterica subsp. salamae serovar [1],40:z35:e,n,x,z15]EDV0904190.1 hypothetical protein [Salmonella enterica subsp. salamae]